MRRMPSLLPICIIGTLLYVSQGAVQNLKAYDKVTLIDPQTVTTTGAITINSFLIANSSLNSSGGGALTINSGAVLTMWRPFTVTGTTSITGTINFGSTSTTSRLMTFTGAVTLNSGAVWNETTTGAIPTFSFGDSLTNNATTFTSQTGSHTFTGTAKTLSGATATSIPNVTITGTYTNNGTLTVSTALAGTGGLTNGATGTLNLGGTSTITTLTASAVGNTVNYNGASQTVAAMTYYNLTLSGSGTKTPAAGTTTVAGNFTLASSVIYAGTTNNPVVNFGGNFSNSGTFNSGTGTCTFNGSGAQTLTGATTFTNLKMNNSGSGLTINNNVTVSTLLTLTSGNITTGANVLTTSATCATSVSRTSGHVVGNLQKAIPAGASS